MQRRWSILTILTGTAILFSTGCHNQSFTTHDSSIQKWAVGIVADIRFSNAADIHKLTQQMVSSNGVAFDTKIVDSDQQATQELGRLFKLDAIDLIVVSGSYAHQAEELARNYPQKRIAIVDDSTPPTQLQERKISNNREKQSFVAGNIAASMNPKLPVGLILKESRSGNDPDWKGVVEGTHYAGSNVPVLPIFVSDLQAPDVLQKLKQIPAKTVILADPISDAELVRLNESGKWVIPLVPLTSKKLYANMIVQPRPFFTQALQEEVNALIHNSWQGKSVVNVSLSSYFEILQPAVLKYGDVLNKHQALENLLSKSEVRPSDYIQPPTVTPGEVKNKTETGS